jgi:hypothetical protein
VKRRLSGGMNLNIRSMLNHTSGVPFVVPRRRSRTSAPSLRSDRNALVRIQVSARGSAVRLCCRAFLGRLSVNGAHTRGYEGQVQPRHCAGPAACVRLPPDETKSGSALPGSTIVAGRNTQPRGPLSKVRSREHAFTCASIEPATQSPGCQMRNVDSWQPGHNPGSTSYGWSIAKRQAGPALLILFMRGGAEGGAPRPTEGCWMCRLNVPHRIPEQCDVREER